MNGSVRVRWMKMIVTKPTFQDGKSLGWISVALVLAPLQDTLVGFCSETVLIWEWRQASVNFRSSLKNNLRRITSPSAFVPCLLIVNVLSGKTRETVWWYVLLCEIEFFLVFFFLLYVITYDVYFRLMLIVKCIPRKGTDQLPDKHSFVNSFALLLTLTICLSVKLVFSLKSVALTVSHCSPRCF